jgi:cellulose synthase/poly-beta-1,6-N-acetylglucosamine synthase-like glycosyltransferase
MNLFLLISLIVTGIYTAFIVILVMALRPGRGILMEAGKPSRTGGISVIVPFRNEARALPATLDALKRQSLSVDGWELIAVDDGSSDDSVAILNRQMQDRGYNFRVLSTGDTPGKKSAIQQAASSARHEICVVLDADSKPGPDWLLSLSAAFDGNTGLIAGPVRFAGKGMWASLVRLEYAGVLAAGLATFNLGRPMFASGANLAWRRKAFFESGAYEGLMHLPSADDTLLLQRMSRNTNWKIKALLDPRACVTSRGPENLKSFWHQRLRWTSTDMEMPDLLGRLAAPLIWLALPLSLGSLLLFLSGAGALWFLPFFFKFMGDLALMRRASMLLDARSDIVYAPLVFLAQLVYGSLVPLATHVSRYRWRDAA